MIWEALTWFHTDYEGDEEDEMWYPYDHFFEGDAKQIIISLVDRCRLVYPKSPDMLLPEFVCDFFRRSTSRGNLCDPYNACNEEDGWERCGATKAPSANDCSRYMGRAEILPK